MTLPEAIPDTWGWSLNWLIHYRRIATDVDIEPALPHRRDLICPDCEYPEAVYLSLRQSSFQLMNYCPECGTVWSMYVARCLDCGGFLEATDSPDDVKCSICGMVWETELIKTEHEDPEF